MSSQSGVHVTEIHDSSIKFLKAHPRFIEAVIDERIEREEEDHAWWATPPSRPRRGSTAAEQCRRLGTRRLLS